MGLVEEDVEAEVVAVEGDAPGAGGGGDAEEDEVVRVLVADARGADELAEEVVDAHGGDGFGVAFGGEGGAEDGHDRGDNFGGLVLEAEAFVAEEEFRVGPASPFGGVDVVGEGGFLFVVEE